MKITSKVAAMAAMAIVAAAAGLAAQVESSLRDARAANRGQAAQLDLQATEIRALKESLAELQAAHPAAPDWIAIAQQVEPSVVTIETRAGLGSGWVGASDASGSSLVTNYHVIAGAWEAGVATVTVRQFDKSFPGTIVKVDPTGDLAVVSIHDRLPALLSAAAAPSWRSR